MRLTELMNAAPKLETRRTNQIAALPLGGRVRIDPWSGRIEMLMVQGAALHSPREKMPFEVAPLEPYVRYQNAGTAPVATATTTTDTGNPQ